MTAMRMGSDLIEIIVSLAFLGVLGITVCYYFVVLGKYGRVGAMWGIWYALDTLEGRYAFRRLVRLLFATAGLGVLVGIVGSAEPI